MHDKVTKGLMELRNIQVQNLNNARLAEQDLSMQLDRKRKEIDLFVGQIQGTEMAIKRVGVVFKQDEMDQALAKKQEDERRAKETQELMDEVNAELDAEEAASIPKPVIKRS